MEKLEYDQYKVKMDGSGRISLRNRRFMRPITPYSSSHRDAGMTEPMETADVRDKDDTVVHQELRRSERSRQAPLRYGVVEVDG